MGTAGLGGSIKYAYERDGYAVVPRVFSSSECTVLREELERIATAQTTVDVLRVADLSTKQRAGISKAQAGAAIFIIGDLPTTGKLLAELVAHRLLVRIASAALGNALLRYHYSNLTVKAPHVGPRINWHRDFPNRFITMHRARFCRLMICLDGMTKFNGPTAFQPGSHRVSDARARREHSRKWPRRVRRERPVLCPPGSVVVIHPKVRHGGAANRSNLPRRNIIVQWGAARDRLIATSLEKWSGATPQALRCAQS